MKSVKYRFTALLLVVCLLAGAVPATAATVAGVGEVTVVDVTLLSDTAALTRNTVNHVTAGMQNERYIEWTAGGQIRPIVVTGDTVYGGALTLDEAAAKAAAAGMSVAAGMNGDFFTVSTGVPLGLTVVNKRILVSDPGLPAVGFLPNGQAFIAMPELKAAVVSNTVSLDIDYINKPRGANGIYLYTPDYGENTRATTHGRHVFLEANHELLTVGCYIPARVTNVVDGVVPVNLPRGTICISAESADAITRLGALTVGLTVNITTSVTDLRYAQSDYIVGGYRILVDNGQITAPTEPTVTRSPRSAIGVKQDGTVVYYTVDGRQGSYSAGLGLNELAARLRALGCVTVIEMDGGGSTDMIARFPGDTVLTRLGRPSDGAPRKVANHIIFINTAPKTGIVREFYVKSGKFAALTGAEIPFPELNIAAVDTNYHPMQLPSNLAWSSSNTNIVTVSDKLRAIAPGTAELSVSSWGWGALGKVEIVVADQPDSIVVSNAATGKLIEGELSLAPNEKIQLKATGLIGGVPAPGGVFYWNTSDSHASVDANGVLTAGSMAGTSTRLFVGMGNTATVVDVLIGRAPSSIEDFENKTSAFSATVVGTGFERNSNKQNVKYGLWSGSFSYDFAVAAEGTASLTYGSDIKIDGNSSYLSMWVKGDGSGNLLNFVMTDSAGQPAEMTAATMNFTDFRQVFIPLMSISKINGLKVVRAPGSAPSGTFIIDQIITASTNIPNASAPKLLMSDLNADGTLLYIIGSATDPGGTLLKKSDIQLTINGVPIPFEFNESTGAVTASVALPMEGVHVVMLRARNSFGNYDRITREFEQPTIYRPQSFTDIPAHWSGKYVEMLDRRGVFRESTGLFRPADVITRAEVAVMMSNVLRLDEAAWNQIILPYEDIAEIPAWALGAVKALYANGFMTGVGLADGRRVFSPNSNFSRAEMFGIIGNTIPKGITKPTGVGALNFEDYYSVPSWSIEYVDMLIGMGVIQGSNNRLNPSDTVTRAEFATILARIS